MTDKAKALLASWDEQLSKELFEGVPLGKQLRAYQVLYALGVRINDATEIRIKAEAAKEADRES